MKRSLQILGALTLCCYLAGCATYRAVPWCPNSAGDAFDGEPLPCDLEPGDRVRLTFVDGERLEAKLVAWDAQVVSVLRGPWGSERGDPVVFARDEIAQVEKRGVNGVAIGVGLVVVTGLVVGLIMVGNTMDQMTFGGG
jgi:hypothetical protein